MKNRWQGQVGKQGTVTGSQVTTRGSRLRSVGTATTLVLTARRARVIVSDRRVGGRSARRKVARCHAR